MNTIDGPRSISLLPPKIDETGTVTKNATGFGDMLSSMLTKVNDSQVAGDQAVQKLESGDANHLHEVMIAAEEADISLRMLVQMRNKALSAYEEIMRMQI
ncbi:flagellar hook-basal body complex protein FliE [Desulfopila sp. IMCC35006]|uniref:flagellar hook-basal body complex protein FliE n=1 Tax=Desulfopila sp. IMCC35006 TaxID=2569542 RepID=UPI0010ACA02C|nr:flagellar hook-basal body complex protein FliE [Desulfopila sp. IMCC35006]TKB25792.1 flagellar hook-basal body complex protein FliE [Desulfopila sp. IMCC35006]